MPDKNEPTVGNKLIKLMTSHNQSLNYLATELLFQLCGEDGALKSFLWRALILRIADMLISLTGFGNAAGLLAMRGLFGLGGVQDRNTLDEYRAMEKQQKQIVRLFRDSLHWCSSLLDGQGYS